MQTGEWENWSWEINTQRWRRLMSRAQRIRCYEWQRDTWYRNCQKHQVRETRPVYHDFANTLKDVVEENNKQIIFRMKDVSNRHSGDGIEPSLKQA